MPAAVVIRSRVDYMLTNFAAAVLRDISGTIGVRLAEVSLMFVSKQAINIC